VASETAFVIAPGESVGQLPPSRGEIADVRASFPQSRWRVTDERLRQVAEIYRAANDRGERPTLAVAQALGYSREYASRLVMRARDAGHLGPAQKGKAGEYQERPVKRRRKKRGQK
ncbi:MAG TPA: DUF6214 family protein, partial [Acidimicrobiia bacterium]|nr:DUF6214 family protein [Acidimicrobiia bacterium]